ncbi:MAG: hypothetical protein ABIZ80_14405, partial [Bryobacteraceae bacterium]
MSFYRKYELAKLIDNGETKTFRASEIATGRLVFLHLLSGMDSRRQTSLLQRLRAASTPDVLEMDDSFEAPYVVTEILEPFSGLEKWLESLTRPSAPGPSPTRGGIGDAGPKLGSPEAVLGPAPPLPLPVQVAVAPPPPPSPPPPPTLSEPPPGDFTRMFLHGGPGVVEVPPAKLTGDTQPSVPPPVLPSSAKPAPDPHAFTRMFLDTDIPSSTPAAPVAAPPAPQPPPAAGNNLGEFTRMFVANTPQPDAPLPPPPRSSVPADEFARMFGEPASQGRPPAQNPQPTPTAPSVDQSEFTRFFQSPIEASPIPVEEIERGEIAPPTPAPHAKPFRGPGEFTVRFGSNSPIAEPARPAQAPMFSGGDASALFGGQQQALGNPPAADQGPSEFTRVFKSPQREGAPAVVAPPANVAPPPPPPVPRPSIPPVLIAVLSILFVSCLIAA